MTKHVKKIPKVGNVLTMPVEDPHIQGSDPCNKDNCMASRAGPDMLTKNYGERDYKVKSTNHGMTFEINGRKYVTVFDTKTAETIYKYDEVYTRTRSKEKARASVKPFKCRLMVEATLRIPPSEPLTEERKAYLRGLQRKKGPHSPKKGGSRRKLSL